MTSGRAGLVRAVVVTAAGGLLVLLAAGRVWSRATMRAPGAPQLPVTVAGHDVAPALPALAIALLALAAAIVAARGTLRRVVGALVVVVAGITFGVAVTAPGSVSGALTDQERGGLGIPLHGSANGWWVLAAAGAVIAVLAGVATVVRGPRWAAMGAKYEAPAGDSRGFTSALEGEQNHEAAWAALDRGEDPTV